MTILGNLSDLGRIVQDVQEQTLVIAPDDDDLLTTMHAHPRNRSQVQPLHALKEQGIWIPARLFRDLIIRSMEVQRVDAFKRNELLDVHGVGGGRVERFQFFWSHRGIEVFVDFVALPEVATLDLLIAGRADDLLLDPRP